MATGPDEIVEAASRLPEADRLLIVSRLLDTLPDDAPSSSDDADGFLAELERRANDTDGAVPVSELWHRN